MLMVPLPFVIAIFAAAFALSEVLARGLERRNGWLLAFLATLVFQEVLIGLRFGYGWEALRQIQPLSAAIMSALAYLAFKRPAFKTQVLVHLTPLLAVWLTLTFWIDGLDTVLAICNLVYAGLLIRLGLAGSDALGWVEVHRAQAVLVLLWLVAALLIVSSITDGAIAFDFWITQGSNTARIAGWTTVLAFIGTAVVLIAVTLRAKTAPHNRPEESAEDKKVFSDLETLMSAEHLHLDPDINLNRIARRMVLPARSVSRAVNSVADCNVSQYINRLRVQHACTLLASTQTAVTQILFESGFNTKSNFNREFTRVTGQSPSAWRAENADERAKSV